MNIKQTDLVKQLEAKSTLGLDVSPEDVIALCGVVNHNGAKMTELSNKLDILADNFNTAVVAIGTGFMRVNTTLAQLNQANASQAETNAEMIAFSEVTTETMAMLDGDIDGVYADMNHHLGGDTESGHLVRESDLDAELPEEVEEVDVGDVIGMVYSSLEDGTPVTIRFGGEEIDGEHF